MEQTKFLKILKQVVKEQVREVIKEELTEILQEGLQSTINEMKSETIKESASYVNKPAGVRSATRKNKVEFEKIVEFEKKKLITCDVCEASEMLRNPRLQSLLRRWLR